MMTRSLPFALVWALALTPAATTAADSPTAIGGWLPPAPVTAVLPARAAEAPPDAAGRDAAPWPRLRLAAARLADLDPGLRATYADLSWRPLWTTEDGRLTPRGAALRAALAETAARHGLDPGRYRLPSTGSAAALDLELSRAAVRLAGDLRSGVLRSPHALHVAYPAEAESDGLLHALAGAADPADALAAAAPTGPLYPDLVRALAQYRAVAAAGGWPAVPGAETLEPGQTDDAQVPALRRRLVISGDLALDALEPSRGDLDSPVYDLRLEAAVRRFQERHGLAVDGLIGPNTRRALNIPVAARIETLLLNLDRLRWMPDQLGARHILVNIAGFEVMVMRDGRPILRSAIVVGKRRQETPAFSDTVEHVVVNPYWNVPKSIAVEEIAPQAARDPSYIHREDMEVVVPGGGTIDPYMVDWEAAAAGDLPYRLRQRPGPANALGRVKILFPNDFAVYLHDTPARSLFDRRVRAFSHGCMRVEKPLELAAEVLDWPVEKLAALIDTGERRWLSVDRPTPVHVTYLTAWVDPDTGAVQFRDDLYGRDADLRPQVTTLPILPDADPAPAG